MGAIRHFLKTFALAELVQGLALTLRIMFRKKATVRYPEEKTPLSPRFRGMHALMCDENGKERCIGCKLCYSKCPQKCIDISTKPIVIQQEHCLHCGNCYETCPARAIERR